MAGDQRIVLWEHTVNLAKSTLRRDSVAQHKVLITPALDHTADTVDRRHRSVPYGFGWSLLWVYMVYIRAVPRRGGVRWPHYCQRRRSSGVSSVTSLPAWIDPLVHSSADGSDLTRVTAFF